MGKPGRAALAVTMALVLAGCTDDDEPVLGAAPLGDRDGRTVTAELADRQEARLDIVSGASVIIVRAADLNGALFRASTPDGSRVLPTAGVDGDTVRVALRDGAGPGNAELRVELSSRVTWRIRLDGGANQQSLDLREGRLAGLEFGAGSTRIDATLPRPSGSVVVRMAGGASVFDLHLSEGDPATVLIAGGAGSATLDGTTRTGIAAGTTLSTGDTAATDRYQVDLMAGVSTFSIDRI
ncbi:MAG TPA: hypothetical protein VFV67_13280 [Actinophytocola sp.]|uniref:hypothetical protein n=1 Tax=Actinophytocola sp. TaxID=1872138 RepID=UPI002DBD83E5|nr:hypothetical protein [Actinophytocola sp.]HEU5471620.1 hypothetical protein [Actinophytocola sp.]